MNYTSLGSFIAITMMASLALWLCQAEGGRLWVLGIKYHVHVVNGFEDQSKSMNLHCWSHDDDLGQHLLRVGEELMWRFGVKFDGSTLFTCDVKQGTLAKRFDSFNATIEGTTCALSGQCYWLVSDAGIYYSTDDFTWEKKYVW